MGKMDQLEIETTSRREGVVVSLRGSASMELCERLNDALFGACESHPKRLVIDLTDLRFICSLGLGSIVAAYLRLQKAGGRLLLASPNEAIREMLGVTRLDTLLPVFDDVATALSAH